MVQQIRAVAGKCEDVDAIQYHIKSWIYPCVFVGDGDGSVTGSCWLPA